MTTVGEGGKNLLRQAVAEGATKTTTVTMELSGDFSAHTHVFIGVQMFDSGGNPILDSTGTLTVTVETEQNGQPEAPPSNVINATAPHTISVAGNIRQIKVVPASLTDTVTYKVFATANRN